MKQEFDAVIKQHDGINGAYIEPPFDVNEVFGAKRVKVLATFDKAQYRGSIVRMGGGYWLGMSQDLRKKIGKSFGDTVHVTIEQDVAERTVDVPPELAEAIKNNPEAGAVFEKLSYSHKKEYAVWINDAKTQATRARRIEKAVQMLSEGKKLK